MDNQKIKIQQEKENLLKKMLCALAENNLSEDACFDPVWQQLFEGVATLNAYTTKMIDEKIHESYFEILKKIALPLVLPHVSKTMIQFMDTEKRLTKSMNLNNPVVYAAKTGNQKTAVGWRIKTWDKLRPIVIENTKVTRDGAGTYFLEVTLQYYGKSKEEPFDKIGCYMHSSQANPAAWLSWILNATCYIRDEEKQDNKKIALAKQSVAIFQDDSVLRKDGQASSMDQSLFLNYVGFPNLFFSLLIEPLDEVYFTPSKRISIVFESNIPFASQLVPQFSTNCFFAENCVSMDLSPVLLSADQKNVLMPFNEISLDGLDLIDVESVMVYAGNKKQQLHAVDSHHSSALGFKFYPGNQIADRLALELVGDFTEKSTLSVRVRVCHGHQASQLSAGHAVDMPRDIPSFMTAKLMEKPSGYSPKLDSSQYMHLLKNLLITKTEPLSLSGLQTWFDLLMKKEKIQIEEMNVERKSLIKEGMFTEEVHVFITIKQHTIKNHVQDALLSIVLTQYFKLILDPGLDVVVHLRGKVT